VADLLLALAADLLGGLLTALAIAVIRHMREGQPVFSA
jgi:hypothetical protein